MPNGMKKIEKRVDEVAKKLGVAAGKQASKEYDKGRITVSWTENIDGKEVHMTRGAHESEFAPNKGPLDYLADLRKTRSSLQKRIAAGESGDGLKKADLKASLRTVEGEIRNLEKSNPGK